MPVIVGLIGSHFGRLDYTINNDPFLNIDQLRYVFVKFADRGLVVNGTPNLSLLNKVGWIQYVFMVCIFYGQFPFQNQIRPNFPENSIKGQICMKLDFDLDGNNEKLRVLGFYPIIAVYFTIKFQNSINRFVKGQNLNNSTCAQFGGKYRRNLFDLIESRNYLMSFLIFLLLENFLILSMQLFKEVFDKDARFLLLGLLWVLFLNVYIGVYVPLKHLLISWNCMPSLWHDPPHEAVAQFYVRRPFLIPRRYMEAQQIEIEESRSSARSFTYFSLKFKRVYVTPVEC